MSFLHMTSPLRAGVVPAILLASLLGRPAGVGGAMVFVEQPLPNASVRSLSTSEDVGLAHELAGRPAVLLLTDAGQQGPCPLGQAAAEVQADYAPWFSWAAVLSGPFSAADFERVRTASPLRFERLFHDRAGAVRSALDLERLPVLLLVDERGTVRQACAADGGAPDVKALTGALESLAAASRRRIAGIEDFRLPLIGGGLVSFLDVAGRDGTMVVFLQSQCLPCARELEVLDFARQRRAGAVSFVAVFIDPAPESRVRGFLGAAGAAPDFVLRDPELKLAGRYGVSVAPSLLVIDTWGEIVLSRSSYREAEREALYADLMTAFDLAARTGGDGSVVGQARRLHEEACAFLREGKPAFALLYQQRIAEMLPGYPSVQLRIAEAAIAAGERELAVRSLAKYLAAQPQTYDSPAVRQTMAGLLHAAP